MTFSDGSAIVDHETIISTIDAETTALLDSLLGGFLGIDLQAEPVLDLFTGGHVLTHLAREADRMADELLAATERPIRPFDAERRWGVEYGGLRPGAVLIEDLGEASGRLEDALEGVDDWSTLDDACREIPARRLVQLLVHQADLHRPWDSVPEQHARVALARLPIVIPELSDIRLVARSHQTPTIAQPSDGQTVVEGDPRALLAWATGRGDETIAANLPSLSRRIWY